MALARKSNRGFTLLEILMAALILAIIGTLTTSSLFATYRTQDAIDRHSDLQEIGTAAINKIRDDLSQTFHVVSVKPLTFFIGEDNGDLDRLDFTSLSRSILTVEGRESDQTEISYKVESDPDQPSLNRLLRRETRHIDGEVDEFGEFATLATNVVFFDLEYSDGQAVRKNWNVRSRDGGNKLPKLIRVIIGLQNENGKNEYFETSVNIALAEDLSIQVRSNQRNQQQGNQQGQGQGQNQNQGQGQQQNQQGSQNNVSPTGGF